MNKFQWTACLKKYKDFKEVASFMKMEQKCVRTMQVIGFCCFSIGLCACEQNTVIQETDKEEQRIESILPDTYIENVKSEEEMSLENCLIQTTTQASINKGEHCELAEWKQAYLNYLDNFTGADSFVYSLIYVDDDAIPELVIDSGFGKEGIMVDGGCQALLTFHAHELDVWKPIRSRFTYIEKENVICNVWEGVSENAVLHSDSIFTIENGKWTYIGGGYWAWRTRGFALINYEVYEYYWEENGADRQVGEDEYNVQLNAIYPKEQEKYPQNYYRLDEIRSVIRTWD